MTIFILTHAPR